MREPDDFAEPFSLMDREKPGAILMVTDSLTVRDSGLMSYAPDLDESFQTAPPGQVGVADMRPKREVSSNWLGGNP